MKAFLTTPAARRTAWLTLVSLLAGLFAPGFTGRAAAQTAPGRTAYMVPFTGAEGVEAEIPLRVGNELSGLLRRLRDDVRVKQPLELLTLSDRNPVIRQAIEEGSITQDQIANPPTDLESAVQFARQLGLTAVIVGKIESYSETEDRSAATVDVTVMEYQVPTQADVEATPTRSVSKSTRVAAKDEREKALLRTNTTQKIAQMVAASLLDAPELAPVEPVAPTEAAPKKKGANPALIALGVLAGIAAIFLIASIGGGKSGDDGAANLNVSNVRAQAEENGVRVTWDPASGATGYNVYRRAAGTQVIRSRSRSRQNDASFELLPSENGTTPSVLGSGRTSFIDTSAQNGVVYEYAVAAVGPNGEVGPRSTTTTSSQAGSNIGTSPQLTATSGNGFVALNWTPSSSFVDGYIIFRYRGTTAPNTGLNSPDELIRVGAVTHYDDTSVENGVSYTYVVQPFSTVNVNGLLAGADSNPVTISGAAGAAPQAPRNVAATVDTTGRVRITWAANPETNIDFYEVLQRQDRSRHRAASGGGSAPWLRGGGLSTRQQGPRTDPRASRQIDLSGFQLVGIAESTQPSFSLGPLTDGTYTFAVRAVNNSGTRGPATAAAAVTVNAALPAPTSITAIGLDRQVRLTWQRVGGDVEAYNIYRSSSPIGPSQLGPSSAPGIARVGTVTGSQTSFDDTNLNNNATFYYAVTSVDSQGAESEFGKGTTPDTGVIAIPHASPASLTFTVDKQNLSGNGMSTTRATVTIKDASNAPAAGVQVDLTTDAGRFVNLPANATTLDSNARQVRALTDLQGQVVIDLQSAVVTTAGQQLSVNLRARAAELPDAVEEQSRTVSFLASRPVVISLSPTTNQLTADRASTTDVTARVLDALGQPVPDNLFSVDFVLESTNGSIRRAGNVQQFPFIDGTPTATVRVPVVNGQAVAVYRSGNDASTLGSPPANIVPIQATAVEEPAVTSRTIITLVPGAPARIDFGGVNQITIPRGQSQTINVVVRDAQNNPVRAGVNVNFAVQPEGPVTVPPTGTTDNNGQISLQITAGPDAGRAVVVGTISGTQVQSQLAVTVQ